MASIQATRLEKGMLIKIGDDLFRVLELQHLTPGNKRGFIQRQDAQHPQRHRCRDQKFRSEETSSAPTLDEREMQYLYNDGDRSTSWTRRTYEQIHISTPKRSATR